MTMLWVVLYMALTVYITVGTIFAYFGYELAKSMSGNPRSAWYGLWFAIAWGPIVMLEHYRKKNIHPR